MLREPTPKAFRFACFIIALVSSHGLAQAAEPTEAPQAEVFTSIVKALNQLPGRKNGSRAVVDFAPSMGPPLSLPDQRDIEAGVDFKDGRPTSSQCGLRHSRMTLKDDAAEKTFQVLVDRATPTAPTELLVVTRRLHVDADGSPRSYSPEDPLGVRPCSKLDRPGDQYTTTATCAVDKWSSGSFTLFQGATKLQDDAIADKWPDFWKEIASGQIQPIRLDELPKEHRPATKPDEKYYFFHSQARNLTAVFNRNIIPQTNAGPPCTRLPTSNFPGYFVSATALAHGTDHPNGDISDASRIAPEECRPLKWINAERVPYFVLPGGAAGKYDIGDVVVGFLRNGTRNIIVYGVAADSGPKTSFGEGSIAFNQQLLEAPAFVENVKALWGIDIDQESGKSVTILVLGGTKLAFNGLYSEESVRTVGQAALQRWGAKHGGAIKRLQSCSADAPPNE